MVNIMNRSEISYRIYLNFDNNRKVWTNTYCFAKIDLWDEDKFDWILKDVSLEYIFIHLELLNAIEMLENRESWIEDIEETM